MTCFYCGKQIKDGKIYNVADEDACTDCAEYYERKFVD